MGHSWGCVKWDDSHKTLCAVLVLNTVTVSTRHVIITLHFKHFQRSNPVAGQLIHWFPIGWKRRLKPSLILSRVNCPLAPQLPWTVSSPPSPPTLSLQPSACLAWVTCESVLPRPLLPLLSQHSSFSVESEWPLTNRHCYATYSPAQKFPLASHCSWTKVKLLNMP